MRVAHISSVHHLDLSAEFNRGYHLALAHLVAESKPYADFYRREVERGALVILDNSDFEGFQFAPEDLVDACDAIGATELMAPETFRDGKKTAHQVLKFAEKVKHTNPDIKIFGTAHGGSKIDFFDCWTELMNSDLVDTIGVSCRFDVVLRRTLRSPSPTLQKAYYRIALMKLIDAILTSEGMVKASPKTKPHHLLGATDAIELYQYRDWPWVRGCDSSTAFVHGQAGVAYSARRGLGVERVGSMDFHAELLEGQISLVRQNMMAVNDIAGAKE